MQPVITVCIPAYRAQATLPRTLAAALDQDVSLPYEVVVCLSADSQAELDGYPDLPTDPRLTILARPSRRSANDARHECVAAASGADLAFTDADALPHRDWLTNLVRASEGGTKVVGGAIANGTPDSGPGTAEYLVEFVDLAPRRPPHSAWHGALCNLFIPAPQWQRFGPFPELNGGGEDTVLTAAARAVGAFAFSGDAVVTHLNRTGAWQVIHHQYDLGRFAAAIARAGPYKWRPLLTHPSLAGVSTLGRFVSLYARAMAWMPGSRLRALSMAPLVLAMLTSWGAGLFLDGIRLDREARRGRASR